MICTSGSDDNQLSVNVTAPIRNDRCSDICIDLFPNWTVIGDIPRPSPENGKCRTVFNISTSIQNISTPTSVRVCRACKCGNRLSCNEETCSEYHFCGAEDPTEIVNSAESSTNATDLPGNKTEENSKRLVGNVTLVYACMRCTCLVSRNAASANTVLIITAAGKNHYTRNLALIVTAVLLVVLLALLLALAALVKYCIHKHKPSDSVSIGC